MNQNFLTPKIAKHLLETYRATPDNRQFLEFLQELGRFYFGQTEVPEIIALLEKIAAGEVSPIEPAANMPTNLKELVLYYERWQELQEEGAPYASREVQRAKFLAGLRQYFQNKLKGESLERWLEEKQTEKVGQVLTNVGIPEQDAPNIGRQIISSLREQTKTGVIETQKIKELLSKILSEVRPGLPEDKVSQAATDITESELFNTAQGKAPTQETPPVLSRPTRPSRPSQPSPPSRPSSPPSLLYLYYKPATWTSLFLNNFAVLLGKQSRTNKMVLEQALERFLQENKTVAQNLPLVQVLRRQVETGTFLEERIERAYFDSEQNPKTGEGLRKQGFDLLRLALDASSQKLEVAKPALLAGRPTSPPPPPVGPEVAAQVGGAVAKQTGNIFKNLVSKAAIAARQLFVNPGLGWLRLPLAAALGIGAVSMPVGLPLKLLMGSGAVGLGLAQARHSPGFFQTFLRPELFARGAVATSRVLVGLAGAGGASLGLPLALILGGTLLFLGFGAFFLSSSPQGIFLKETVVGLEENYESEFIGLEKTVSPASSSTTPVTANFTITIAAKKNKLTNIVVKDHFSVYSSGGDPPPPSVTLPTTKDSLAVGETDTVSFSVELGQEFQDSIVTNTVEVTADVEDGPQGEKVTRSASILIGETPTSCFVFESSGWSPSDRNHVLQAIGFLSQASSYMGKLCSGGEITLRRGQGDPGYAGMVIHQNIIIFFNNSFTSTSPIRYVLAHESGHVFAWRNNLLFKEFLRIVNPRFADDKASNAPNPTNCPTENPLTGYENAIPTYPYKRIEEGDGKKMCLWEKQSEDFAETIAVYAVWRVVPSLGDHPLGVIRDTYTKHWSFAKNNIFDGFEF